jgi:hypothetical protein
MTIIIIIIIIIIINLVTLNLEITECSLNGL